jgi:hypothetical protein
MLNSLTKKKILAICLFALPALGTAQHRAAVGPLESIQVEKSRLTVLGQTFEISNATKIAVNGELIGLAQGSEALVAGHSIYVEGVDVADRSVATLVSISDDRYVPGGTSVYIFGNIAEVSNATGTFRIGSLWIDSSAAAPEFLANIKVGAAVETLGIQPVEGGRLVGVDLLSIGGTDKQSIGGTGAQLQSIGGTGKQKQSIGGTGVQLQSIGGTGKQKQSIGVTDHTQLQSIGGTGKQRLSIGGTGVQLQSIGGTGKQKQAIGVTDAQLQSIGGTGKQKLSIGGTGVY